MQSYINDRSGRLSRRSLLSIGAAWSSLAMLTGCSAKAGPASGPGRPTPRSTNAIDSLDLAGKKIELTFWHTQTGPRADKLKAIVDAFNASQPGVQINPEFQGDYTAIYKKLLVSVTARQLPDLAVSYPSMVSEYQAANVVLPLDDYVASPRYGLTKAEQADYVRPYWDEGRYPEFSNQLLSFPFTKSVLVLYYNADKLQSAGVTKPPESWTWEDFASACKAVTAGGTRGWAVAVSASTFDGMVYSRGGKLISDDQKHWLFNQQAGQNTLGFFQTAVREGWGYRISQTNGDQADFGAGRAIFTLSSSSGFPFYTNDVNNGAKFRWSVANLPHAAAAAPATALYGGSLAVFRSTPEKQLASWLFLRYFSSPAVTADWSVATGYTPVRNSALQSETVQKEIKSNAPYSVLVNQIAQYSRSETSVKGTQDTRTYIEDAITRVTTDLSSSPKRVLDQAAQKGDEALAQA